MKGVIDDYYGRSSKPTENSSPLPLPGSTGYSKKSLEPEHSEEDEGSLVNGKEKLKSKKTRKLQRNIKDRVKPVSTSEAMTSKGKPKKPKSLTVKKKTSGVETYQDNVFDKGVDNVTHCPSPNFSLKIKLKSKEQNEEELVIEECSSSDQADSPSIKKLNENRSPLGTMLKYFVLQKKASEVENGIETDSKPKEKKEISDFFNPKQKKVTCDSSNDKDKVAVGTNVGGLKEEISETVDETFRTKLCKTTKKSRKKNLSVSGTNLSTSRDHPPNLKTKKGDVKETHLKENSASRGQSKSLKKSLSLLKNLNSSQTNDSENQKEPKQTVDTNEVARSEIVQSMNNSFNRIIMKTAVVELSDLHSCKSSESSKVAPKKRKRGVDDDIENAALDKLCETYQDDSPVKSKRKLCKFNAIASDSDDDTSSKVNARELEKLPSKTCNITDVKNDDTEVTPKAEDSKRNSLMKYFSKVSKEELLAKVDKVELKVKAMVHSPPTTPSKKEKRRSINSLPGGAASLSKRKGSLLKVKLKENMNAIDVISVEEVKAGDIKTNNNTSILISKKHTSETPGTDLPTESLCETLCMSPKKDLTASKPFDSPDVRTYKRGISKSKAKDIANKDKTLKKGPNSAKTVEVVEESLATPLMVSYSQNDLKEPDISSSSQLSWKMRVCLPNRGLPSSQGTLLEEESDCEEIFLSERKKRKLNKRPSNNKSKQASEDIDVAVLKDDNSSLDIVFEKEISSEVKIAPLFTRKADTQARQQFLLSGVPEKVKRVLETQRSFEEHEQDAEIFPKNSHVQQKNDEDWVWNLPSVNLSLLPDIQEKFQTPLDPFSLVDFVECCDIKEEVTHILNASKKGPEMCSVYGLPIDVVKPILRLIRQESPDFKVVNTFKVLRSKLRDEEIAKAASLSASSETPRPKRKSSNRKSTNSLTVPSYRATVWTEKYKPSTSSEIVGNIYSVQQLKRWLEAWRKASEDASKMSSMQDKKNKKKKKGGIDDDDDFVVSDDSSEEGSGNLPVGVAVLYGPNGSGKTCSVYALAKDLGYKVLEVSASERRNGKLVLSKLSEATQSHQVQQRSEAQGFSALFRKNVNSPKNKKVKSGNSLKNGTDLEEEKTKKMSLILFEDVDVVFDEEDEGFLSAIANLVSTSKRPVILTTTDPENSSVNRFLNSSSLILEFSSLVNPISTWLQLVSIVEGVYAAPEAVKDLVMLCKGDFRRALLQMQLWVTSGGNNLPRPSLMVPHKVRKSKKALKPNVTEDDDLSGDDDDADCKPSIPANPDCIAAMLGTNYVSEFSKPNDGMSGECSRPVPLKIPFPLDLGCYWWNIPPMLSLKQVEHAPLPVVMEPAPLPRKRKLLDDSFVATFCMDDGEISDCAANEKSDATCSQGTSSRESLEVAQTSTDTSCTETAPYKSYCSLKEMSAITKQMICLSTVDLIAASSQPLLSSNLEPVARFSQLVLKDSLSLVKSDIETSCCMMKSLAQDICYCIGVKSLSQTRQGLSLEDSIPFSEYNPCLPNQEELRWRDAHAETEQAALAAFPLYMYLEHCAVSTDYMPSLRSLCRLERSRSATTSKRNNRFYHYLKSIVPSLTETQLEILCQTFSER